jgi:peptide chain release factor 1
MREHLLELERTFEAVTAELARPEVASDPAQLRKLSKQYSDLEKVVSNFRELQRVEAQLDDARQILRDESDRELREMAEMEVDDLGAQKASLERELAFDARPRILESL